MKLFDLFCSLPNADFVDRPSGNATIIVTIAPIDKPMISPVIQSFEHQLEDL
jgi:hypothetical protein